MNPIAVHIGQIRHERRRQNHPRVQQIAPDQPQHIADRAVQFNRLVAHSTLLQQRAQTLDDLARAFVVVDNILKNLAHLVEIQVRAGHEPLGCLRVTQDRGERAGIWHIGKPIFGRKIHESTGTGDLKKAELILARRIEDARQAKTFGIRPERTFREAATRFLEENLALKCIGDYALHLRQWDPYIGDVALERVHLGTLKPFIEDRQAAGLKHKSINLALSVVRRILNLAARLWRDESGHSWLETAPLIQLLPTTDARKPYPISWDEQARLMQALPDHLARMCMFKVNTGCREQEVCQLRWAWEIPVPELDTSVFIIPGALIKNREDRLIVLTQVAKSVVDERRGMHATRVFSYGDIH